MEKEKFLYEIKDLVCAYENGKKIVLKIPDLLISKGKLIAFLGVSGSGKTTILETLGLMKNTIHDGKIHFLSTDTKEPVRFEEIWEKDDDEIADLRNIHMSFIFQETNLMDNFTAYQNICIPQLVQGIEWEAAKENALKFVEKIGLGDYISDNTSHTDLSGGQKQRLAFVRAITPKFTVLFGDEPTGNLDQSNAREMMKVLREHISQNNNTAIIVSHNIDLMLEYMDEIIILTRSKESGYSEIRTENQIKAVYGENKAWIYKGMNLSSKDLKKEIENLFKEQTNY